LATVIENLARHRIEVVEALAVDSQHWWSLLCEQGSCCPPGGHLRLGPASVVVSRAIYAGLVALPDRAAVAG
jgi:hypothetical protein